MITSFIFLRIRMFFCLFVVWLVIRTTNHVQMFDYPLVNLGIFLFFCALFVLCSVPIKSAFICIFLLCLCFADALFNQIIDKISDLCTAPLPTVHKASFWSHYLLVFICHSQNIYNGICFGKWTSSICLFYFPGWIRNTISSWLMAAGSF